MVPEPSNIQVMAFSSFFSKIPQLSQVTLSNYNFHHYLDPFNIILFALSHCQHGFVFDWPCTGERNGHTYMTLHQLFSIAMGLLTDLTFFCRASFKVHKSYNPQGSIAASNYGDIGSIWLILCVLLKTKMNQTMKRNQTKLNQSSLA